MRQSTLFGLLAAAAAASAIPAPQVAEGHVISVRRVPDDLIKEFPGRSEWKLRIRKHFSLKGQPPSEINLLMLKDECELYPHLMLHRQFTFFAQANAAWPFFHSCDVAEVLMHRGELNSYFELLPGLAGISSLKMNMEHG